MHKEEGERRDFLPELVAVALDAGCHVRVERGIGSGMGIAEGDYTSLSRRVEVVDRAAAWDCDLTLVLRSPEVEEFEALMKPGGTVIAMLHFPTRPRRVAKLTQLGVDAVSLDSIVDDGGSRLVENTRAVGWNGVEASFAALEQLSPWRLARGAAPLRVTVLGSGQVGRHAVDAATKYGSRVRVREWEAQGRPPVIVTVVGRALMQHPERIEALFRETDVLVDASQRADPSTPLVSNSLLGVLPAHAVVCDLVVDPYVLTGIPRTVRSLEGIPKGDLDTYVFPVNHPAWSTTVPPSIPQNFRRTVTSCYSWPGIHPKECMEHYGRQLSPLLEKLIERGGAKGLRSDQDALERALWRASLHSRAWATPGERAA